MSDLALHFLVCLLISVVLYLALSPRLAITVHLGAADLAASDARVDLRFHARASVYYAVQEVVDLPQLSILRLQLFW